MNRAPYLPISWLSGGGIAEKAKREMHIYNMALLHDGEMGERDASELTMQGVKARRMVHVL